MDTRLKTQDRIDRFLKGQMTKLEESVFLKECKTNKQLRKDAYLTALLVKALKNKINK